MTEEKFFLLSAKCCQEEKDAKLSVTYGNDNEHINYIYNPDVTYRVGRPDRCFLSDIFRMLMGKFDIVDLGLDFKATYYLSQPVMDALLEQLSRQKQKVTSAKFTVQFRYQEKIREMLEDPCFQELQSIELILNLEPPLHQNSICNLPDYRVGDRRKDALENLWSHLSVCKKLKCVKLVQPADWPVPVEEICKTIVSLLRLEKIVIQGPSDELQAKLVREVMKQLIEKGQQRVLHLQLPGIGWKTMRISLKNDNITNGVKITDVSCPDYESKKLESIDTKVTLQITRLP